jgi:F0F1-type ATP synthase assembly protein I
MGGEEGPGRNNDRWEGLRRAGPYMGIGTMFAASLLLLTWAGYKADGWLGTKPWLSLGGALLGLIVGFYNFFAVVLWRPPE